MSIAGDIADFNQRNFTKNIASVVNVSKKDVIVEATPASVHLYVEIAAGTNETGPLLERINDAFDDVDVLGSRLGVDIESYTPASWMHENDEWNTTETNSSTTVSRDSGGFTMSTEIILCGVVGLVLLVGLFCICCCNCEFRFGKQAQDESDDEYYGEEQPEEDYEDEQLEQPEQPAEPAPPRGPPPPSSLPSRPSPPALPPRPPPGPPPRPPPGLPPRPR